jgi:hypothetical protein
MTDHTDTLLAFVGTFEASIARHRHWLREPFLLTDLRDAALRGDARRVANFAAEVARLIRRERLWHLESLASARAHRSSHYATRRQHFHDLAHESVA